MATELQSCIIQNGCTGFYFSDTTGAYDVNLNPGGYGAPNITIASVATAVLSVIYAGATEAIEIDVYPTLPTTNVNGVYSVTAEDLGLDEMPSGWTRVTYTITGNVGGGAADYSYSVTKLVFFDCELACCIASRLIEAAAAVVNGDCCNECKDEKVKTALYLEAVLEGARAATCSGLEDVVTTNVEYLETQCGESPCSGC